MSMGIDTRIKAFCEVRDMPYFIATQGEADCCCSTKAYLLGCKFAELGLSSRHRLCWFRWEALGLPPAVLAISHEELPSHQFLEVLIPERNEWVVVDCTWDSALKGTLPVNDWDGLGATPCAVPIERLCTEEETRRIFKECEDAKAIADYFKSQGPFLRGVNSFLQSVRRGQLGT